MSESEAELERVTVRFRGLTIDIARDSGSRGSLGSYDLVGETGARTETGPLEGSSAAPASEPSLGDRLASCTSARDLNHVAIGSFAEQARGLTATGEWTAQGRAARALLAGFSAGKVLSGEASTAGLEESLLRLFAVLSTPRALKPDVEGHRLHSTCPARRVPRSFLATTGFTMSCNSLPRARLREGGRLALIYFVDVPWRFLRGFRKVASARGGPELIPMTLDRVTVRPIRTAAETAVDAWIGGIVLGEQPEFGAPRAGPSGTAQAPEADRLAARVRELESQLQLASAPAPGLQARPPAPMGGGAFAAAGRHSRLAGDERAGALDEAGLGDGMAGDCASLQRLILAQMSDNRATASSVRRRMGAEAMGVAPDNVPSNLMLDYVERKMPVGGQRARKLDGETSGFLRPMLGRGRSHPTAVVAHRSFGPELRAMNKRRQGIRPFQKLIPSAWMSANIAYVKEMDYLGARLTGGTPSYDAGLTPLASACLTCKEVVADRIKWTLPPTFDPIPFLTDPVVRMVYLL
eukprot:s3666_g12.t1